MKKAMSVLLALAIVGLVTPVAMAQEDKNPESICPTTLMKEDCTKCHTMSGGKFVLKETPPDAHLDYPTGVKIVNYGKPDAYGTYTLGEVDYSASNQIDALFQYLKDRDIKVAKIEILSGGGNLLLGWRIKGLMDEWTEAGNIVETRVRGVAASAAFFIFAAGTKGHRIVNSTAELMAHEVRSWQGGMFFIKEITPSGAEEEAKVYKHLQDTISTWLATRGNLSKEKLDSMMKFKEFWMTGKQAKEYGFADVVIGE